MTVQFDLSGPPVTPRDAATVVVVRPAAAGIEIFFVKRRAEVRFMGGAYVFPGGKLDAADADLEIPCDLDAAAASARLADPDATRARALFVAAARETLEEAGVLFATGSFDANGVAGMRAALEGGTVLRDVLRSAGAVLRASALHPWCRWITPKGETRRFDARFFIAAAPDGIDAKHDEGETVASCWLTPADALARAARREIVIVPPTWRCLEVLAACRSVSDALALAGAVIPELEPIVTAGDDGSIIVALPGDVLHPAPSALLEPAATAARLTLATRFVYRDGSWSAETARKH